MGLNKFVNLINFVNGRLNWDRKIEQKIHYKYDQPTFPRVTHSGFDLGKDIIQSIIGVLKQFDIMFKTSDAVQCFVDVAFNVACVTWKFNFSGIRNGPITFPILWDETW